MDRLWEDSSSGDLWEAAPFLLRLSGNKCAKEFAQFSPLSKYLVQYEVMYYEMLPSCILAV